MNKEKKKFPRHFVHKHPLFTSKKSTLGVPWNDSVYYLWWEFLRRNEGYKRTCENGGTGRYSSLFEDFGDIHSTDFKKWWSKDDRGARLFAEPATPKNVAIMLPDEVAELPKDLDPSSFLIVGIPLRLPKEFVFKKIRDILKKKHPRKRGQRLHHDSIARYPITKQFSLHSLKQILSVYDMRKENPKLPLWEIGQNLKIGSILTKEELSQKKTGGHTAKKQVLASTVSRMLKKAQTIIAGVGQGKFPETS